MVHRKIWADSGAPKSLAVAMGYEELGIVTMKKTHKKSTNIKQLSKANPIEGPHIIKSKIGEQQS